MGVEAVLFPHIALGERDLKRALWLFDHLRVCSPWHLETMPTPLELAPCVVIQHPPEALRPPSDFKKVLAEHRRWIGEHQDRGLTAFLATLRNGLQDQESTWEIRKGIRAGGRPPDVSLEEKGLEWHLVLHLLFELERARLEADDAIAALRRLGSPLKDAMGEEPEAPGVLDDLHGAESRPPMDENHLLRIINAWVGLFGEHLGRCPFALTFYRELPNFVMQGLEEDGADRGDTSHPFEARFEMLDPADLDPEAFLAVRERSDKSGREALAALAALLQKESQPAPDEIQAACRRVESAFLAPKGNEKRFAVSLLALPADAGKRSHGWAAAVARQLSARVLVLVEGMADGR